MTYSEVLQFLYSQLPMYQKVGKSAFKKDLSNTLKLCAALDNPQFKFPTIHIAGTNGKGSTGHMIAGILQASGLSVGLYTSPHYKDFRERIKINGKYIPKSKVIDFVEHNQGTIKTVKPSFFEMTVGLAFDYFANQEVDIAVIETGLGGRLDSTNIIRPLVSVITNIGLDHQAMLGDTIPLIATEKAGIMKPGIPCVIGKRQEDTTDVFKEVADRVDASLTYAEDHIEVTVLDQRIDRTRMQVTDAENNAFEVSLPSGVAYNIENCRTAIAAIQSLNSSNSFKISLLEIQDGLSNFKERTKYIGRWHIKSSEPLILLDAAHNVDGITGLFEALANYKFETIHIILGMVSDKDASKIFKLLPSEAKYYFCSPNVPRGKDRIELQMEALDFQLKGRTYVSCKNAMIAAKRAAKKGDLILGTGSSFVVAELV